VTRITFNADGSFEGHMSSDLDRLVLIELGKVTVTRKTTVEWEDVQWVARVIGTGELICAGPSREFVLGLEADFVESRLTVDEWGETYDRFD